MKVAIKIKRSKILLVRMSESLNKYDDKSLFPSKLKNVNEW